MKVGLALVCLLVGSSFVADGKRPPYPVENGVIILSDENFQEFLESTSHVFLKFYKTGCPHCETIKEEFELAVKKIKKVDLDSKWVLAQLNIELNPITAQKYSISEIPQFIAFINEKQYMVDCERNITSWTEFLKALSGNSVQNLSSIAELNVAKTKSMASFYYHGDIDSIYFRIYQSLAAFMKSDNSTRFYYLEEVCRECRKYISLPKPMRNTANAIRRYDAEEIVVWESLGPVAESSLKSFVYKHMYPIVSEWTPERFEKIMPIKDYDAMVLVYPLGKPKLASKLFEEFKWACFEFRETGNRYSCLSVRATDKKFLKEGFEIPKKQVPTVFIYTKAYEGAKYKKFLFHQDKEVTTDNIIAWEEEYRTQKVEEYYRSQSVPDNAHNDVFLLVGSTVRSVINDPAKDVLLKNFDPQCGWCKKLKPTYEELAIYYEEDPHIIIAEIDAVHNDSPIKDDGYPIMYLYPAKNAPPVKYQGPIERTLDSLIEFVEQNRQTTVNIIDL